jgi:hypothetical protein
LFATHTRTHKKKKKKKKKKKNCQNRIADPSDAAEVIAALERRVCTAVDGKAPGIVVLSALENHVAQWGIPEVAAANGFQLVHTGPFPWDAFPGYEHKRHHSNRSFQGSRAGESLVLLVLEPVLPAPAGGALPLGGAENGNAADQVRDGGTLQVAEFRCTVCARDDFADAAAHAAHIEALRPIADPFFRCEQCHTPFPTARAVAQHQQAIAARMDEAEHRTTHVCRCRRSPGTWRAPPERGGCLLCTGCYFCIDSSCRSAVTAE